MRSPGETSSNPAGRPVRPGRRPVLHQRTQAAHGHRFGVQRVDHSGCYQPLVREPLDAESALRLAHILKAIADPARLRLLSLVAAHEGGEACVCDLTEPLGLTQPTGSHHLKVLVDAGLLTRDKRGVWVYFALVPGALDSLATVLSGENLAAAVH